MSMEVLTENSRFDPTPEEIKARDVENWRALQVGYEAEHMAIAEQVEQLTARLRSVDQCVPANRHDESVNAIERVRVADQLDHKKARLVDIADAIAAHRKAKP